MLPNFSYLLKFKYIIFIVIYLLIRISILNVNWAEWGDSYRILRASEYLQNYTYPQDEKRPFLFSLLLTLTFSEDLILSGRIWMLIISLLLVGTFYLLLEKINFSLSESQKFLALVLFSINPLFLYWSIRVYADSLFLLLSLFSFVIFYDYLKKNNFLNLVFLSFLPILAILTRFEGYILWFSILLGLIFSGKNKLSFLLYLIITSFLYFVVLNYPNIFFYQNPLASSYVDEASSRSLSVREVLNFSLQLLFLLGNLFTFYFIAFSKNKVITFIKSNLVLFFAFGGHLALSFIWYAAVPRLFLPLLPLLIILFCLSLDEFFSITNKISFKKYFKSAWEKENLHYFILILLVAVYFVGQKYLKLQFLLTKTSFFSVIILISLVMIPLVLFHFKKSFVFFLIILNLLWSGMFIYLEKDSLKIVSLGAKYLKESFPKGIVLTNDVSSVSRYYFEDGIKYSSKLESGKNFEKELLDSKASYVLVTNEHNPDMSFTPSKHPYIEILKEFNETINGVNFFTYIAKVKSK